MCLLLLMVTAMCSFARTGFVLRREGHLLGFGNGCPFYSFGKGLLGRIKTVKSGWRNWQYIYISHIYIYHYIYIITYISFTYLYIYIIYIYIHIYHMILYKIHIYIYIWIDWFGKCFTGNHLVWCCLPWRMGIPVQCLINQSNDTRSSLSGRYHLVTDWHFAIGNGRDVKNVRTWSHGPVEIISEFSHSKRCVIFEP